MFSPGQADGLAGWVARTPAGPACLRGLDSSTAQALGGASDVFPESDHSMDAPSRPTRGVLVVGMGDEDRGDGGVGRHVVRLLAALDWPGSVVFCQADKTVVEKAERFSRVILVDAIDGPECPGSLYRADPEELLSRSVGGEGSGLGLLTMMPPTVRRRLAIFGIQPGNTDWGSSLSLEVVASLPLLVPFLRAYILESAAALMHVN